MKRIHEERERIVKDHGFGFFHVAKELKLGARSASSEPHRAPADDDDDLQAIDLASFLFIFV